jgi:hypothetical protein
LTFVPQDGNSILMTISRVEKQNEILKARI